MIAPLSRRDFLASALAATAAGKGPDVLALQPHPIGLGVIRVDQPGYRATVISRKWAPGDADRCRLCPAGTCCADPWGTCTMLVPGVVPAGGLALFRRPSEGGGPC
jgi:hypothetical protein